MARLRLLKRGPGLGGLLYGIGGAGVSPPPPPPPAISGTASLGMAVTAAREELNDTAVGFYRYSDAEMLAYGNDALDAIVQVRPELFYEVITLTCTAGETIQVMPATASLGLVRVIRVAGGGGVRETSAELLDAEVPDWHSGAPAQTINWARLADDPMRFLIFPPAPTNLRLVVEHVAIPQDYASLSDIIRLPRSYIHIIMDYILHRCYGRDRVEQNMGLSDMFLQRFYTKLGVSKKTNEATKPAEPKPIYK